MVPPDHQNAPESSLALAGPVSQRTTVRMSRVELEVILSIDRAMNDRDPLTRPTMRMPVCKA